VADLVATARRIVSAVAIPVIADADNGYGNTLNVIRRARSTSCWPAEASRGNDVSWPEAGNLECDQ
jgi:2-methylisocitrate lyase-like PEP mutase family enzyme